jgi:hypothetical protein
MSHQLEGYSQDQVNQAICSLPFPTVAIPIDLTADWKEDAANDVVFVQADFACALNLNKYMTFPVGSTYPWIRPGIYEVRIEASITNTNNTIDADINLSLSSPDGLTVYHSMESEFDVYSKRAVPGLFDPRRQFVHTFIQAFPGQWSDDAVQFAFRLCTPTASATVEVSATTQAILRRLGNN